MMNETALNTAGSVLTFLGAHPDVAGVSLAVAFAQLLVVGYWLWRWKRDGDQRYRRLAWQATISKRRHEEAMAALWNREQQLAERSLRPSGW